ncbi:RNA exonuclease 5 [Microplitis mediator]|uniref:RNA exonuclease 5 n=1 Tax=Microplitis mediator TaxID=375433 RepID=UPI002552849E|nr:RNA exonuclease 5 [Microplitis mediator]XP_057321369.1 RNA exonuclease 5 [Microplitis mediator]
MTTEKQRQRLEKKKKKAAAFLEIAKLNDKDKAKALELKKSAESCNLNNEEEMSAQSPRRKRTCSESLDEKTCEITSEKNSDGQQDAEAQVNKKPRLIGEEYQKLKQQLRERKKLLTSKPRFRLKGAGENASLTVNIDPRDRVPIFLSDIQHLLMYSLVGNGSPYLPSRWCHLEKYNKLSHTVVFVVEGLTMYHFSSYESLFPNIKNLLEHRLEVVTPATIDGSVVEQLAAVPLTSSERKKLIDKYGSLPEAEKKAGDIVKLLRYVFPMQQHVKQNDSVPTDPCPELPPSDKFPRTQLLLSLSQLIDENCPVRWPGALASKYRNYIFTKDVYLEVTPKSPMFGLDCEMCLTTNGSELARICIVNEDMDVVYETLVKPENKITNYLTEYSGITEKLLDNVTTKLSDVQEKIRELLPPDAILVGQSLYADLHALQMLHPYIIDTSVIYNITGDRYRKSKLQVLAREFLDERIQEHKGGHCPTEDARASLKLAKLKLANSLNFGDAVLIGQQNLEEIFIKRKLGSEKLRDDHSFGVTIFKHIVKDKKTISIVGTNEVLNEYSKYLKTSSLSVMDDANFDKDDQVRLVAGNSNKQVVTRASEIVMEHALTICHIKFSEEKVSDKNIEKTCRSVNKWVHKIWQQMAINGFACVIFGGEKNANGACFLNLKKDVTPLQI